MALARSQSEHPVVAATPVQDLRSRASVLLKDAKSRMSGIPAVEIRRMTPFALTDAQLAAIQESSAPHPAVAAG